jgi:hypothetical protein
MAVCEAYPEVRRCAQRDVRGIPQMNSQNDEMSKSAGESDKTVGKLLRQLGPGIWIGYLLGALIYVACFVVAFMMRPTSEWWLNLLLCFFGGVAGWSVGVLLSPMTTAEESKFTGYGKALSAFVTGFVVAKLELLLKGLSPNPQIDTIVVVGRLLLLGTTFIIAFQFTFIARWNNRLASRESTRSVDAAVSNAVEQITKILQELIAKVKGEKQPPTSDHS